MTDSCVSVLDQYRWHVQYDIGDNIGNKVIRYLRYKE